MKFESLLFAKVRHKRKKMRNWNWKSEWEEEGVCVVFVCVFMWACVCVWACVCERKSGQYKIRLWDGGGEREDWLTEKILLIFLDLNIFYLSPTLLFAFVIGSQTHTHAFTHTHAHTHTHMHTHTSSFCTQKAISWVVAEIEPIYAWTIQDEKFWRQSPFSPFFLIGHEKPNKRETKKMKNSILNEDKSAKRRKSKQNHFFYIYPLKKGSSTDNTIPSTVLAA